MLKNIFVLFFSDAFIANVMGYMYDADASKAMRFPAFEISGKFY